jgi:ABC-type nitrate/sulfonate/bicarbonate transport system permease component
MSARPRWDQLVRGQPATKRGRKVLAIGSGCAGIAACLGLWQLLVAAHVLDQLATPTMVTAMRNLVDSIHTAHLWTGVGQTLEAAALGFLVGSAIGIAFGTIVGLNDFAYASCFLVIEFFKTIPIIAIIPLAVLLYGTTMKMTVLLIIFGIFFPTVIQTIYGVRSVDPVIRDTAKAFRIKGLHRFFYVHLPSAAPYLATSLRLGATGALLLAILSELIAGGSGIGLQLLSAEAAGAGGYTYGLLIITGCIGMLLVTGVTAIERRVLAWHEVYRGK